MEVGVRTWVHFSPPRSRPATLSLFPSPVFPRNPASHAACIGTLALLVTSAEEGGYVSTSVCLSDFMLHSGTIDACRWVGIL